ncbi:hypothetical protein BDN72DRAFT_763651 [Pluteus cervinus]|uniref:Uncharacterized protein n=1 Tax=Pluteus cervinus TaxID=181527 RepID=A0ACD3B2E7_9AGAR|nr:hypothetical protein BDN72DRAFT_763651 [Pluteus cervinus]
MSFFAPAAAQFLKPPSLLSRKGNLRSVQQPVKDVEEFLSSDLEISFASTVSLHSPPRDNISLSTEGSFAEPMDISPAPKPRTSTEKVTARPRAFTSAARLFGSDISNNSLAPPKLAPAASIKSNNSTQSNGKRTQRTGLPLEWLAPARMAEPSSEAGLQTVPASPADDAMDVDSSYNVETAPTYNFEREPISAAPTITTFNHLFYETASPRRSLESPAGPQPKKRRSLSPEPARLTMHQNSSSPMLSSPSKEEVPIVAFAPSRISKPTLQGLGAPTNALKRPRRPIVSALVVPTEAQQIQSAYPSLTSKDSRNDRPFSKGLPPVRRAFSALIAPSGFPDLSSPESSFDGPDMSSPAQAYAKRQQVRTIRRCDGTEDFRPLTAVPSTVRDSPSSRLISSGLPGFGDKEQSDKILPCHRVREDGLMRIKPSTLDDLLNGRYDDRITDYHIIDCRFDYEYNGGHIKGAVNINTTAAVEELLLGPSLTKPRPAVSGDTTRKTILVFHCEFSAKRAPTFAKHLRAKDRAMNQQNYPKIHYPETYVLEGGYCQYFKSSPTQCEPQAYVTMDDPTHASSRREDLDQFRKAKFGRHKSYAFGEAPGSKAIVVQQPSQTSKRNTAPSGSTALFSAAAVAARSRRTTAALCTLPEDANTTVDADDTDVDIGDSPCPPPTKNAFKGKKIGRAPLARAETYGPARMPY